MAKMGLEAICRRTNASRPHPQHPIYPYLVRNVAIARPNQVWRSDITFIPVLSGFLYLVALLDRAFCPPLVKGQRRVRRARR